MIVHVGTRSVRSVETHVVLFSFGFGFPVGRPLLFVWLAVAVNGRGAHEYFIDLYFALGLAGLSHA